MIQYTRLKQRYPFLLVDRILEIEDNRYVKAIKNVSINEEYFVGHFPENPIMPGVLIIESMAQAGAFLSSNITAGYLTEVKNVKFLKFVKPGDQIVLHATLLHKIQNYMKAKVVAMVEESIVAKGEIVYYSEKH